jgi:hypothetical protein
MIPKKPALGLDPMVETGLGQDRAQSDETGRDSLQLNRIAAWTVFFYRTYQQNQFSYESRIESKRKRPNLLQRNTLRAALKAEKKKPVGQKKKQAGS